MIVKRDFTYTPKNENRKLHIYLPDDYDYTDERYPVMYFFDGHNLFFNEDATYGKSWGLKEFMDGWSKKMIIVGIECSFVGQERLSEYLPYPANEGSRFEVFEPTGKATMDWIVEEIKPVIDRDYRTIPFRECTGIAGSSMGGLMSLYTAVHYNRWFSKAGCVSSSIGICMGPLMDDMRSSAISADTRVYLSWGTNEAFGIEDPTKEDTSSKTYFWNREAADYLKSLDCAVKMECQVGGHHCEADWEKLVPSFMNFLWTE